MKIHFTVFANLDAAVNAPEYRELIDHCPDATLFNDWPWLSTWNAHLVCDQRVFLVGRTHEGQLVAFLGLRISDELMHGVPAKVARLLQYPWADRVGLLLHAAYLHEWEAMLDCLDAQSDNWDAMVWGQWCDSQGLRERALVWSQKKNAWLHSVLTCSCPVLFINGNSEDEMIASYPSKMRTDLKRRRKKLEQMGAEIKHFRPNQNDAVALVEALKNSEAQSWKGDEGVGIFTHPQGAAFFADVAQRLAQEGQLDVALIYLEGQLASYRFGFYYRKRFLDYSVAYLPEHNKLALGRILLDEVVLSAAREGYEAVDASRVGSTTKHILLERTDQVIPHWRLYWFNKNTKGLLLKGLVTLGKPLAKRTRLKLRQLRA